MNKKNIIILCTSSYPYGTGETFLESEIPVLSKYFESIMILPKEIPNAIKRSTPKNVSVAEIESADVNILNALREIISRKELRKELWTNLKVNFKRNKVLIQNLQWALSERKRLNTVLSHIQSKDRTRLILYSYWMDHSALAMALLDTETKLFCRVHGWDVYEERHLYNYLPLREFMLSSLSRIGSVSKNAKQHLDLNYPAKVGSRVSIQRLGVNASVSLEEIDHSDFTHVISIGSMISLKRIKVIAEFYSKQRQTSQIRWIHFGSGELLNEYQEKFGEEIFVGQKSNQDILDTIKMYKSQSVLINTSQYEGIPVSMMEAMSLGIPCIGPNVGGVGEIITDSLNGVLMRRMPMAEDVKTAYDYLLGLTDQEALSMRTNAWKSWNTDYNAEKNYSVWSEALNDR